MTEATSNQSLRFGNSSIHFNVDRPVVPRQPKSPPEGDVEILRLSHFAAQPRIDFETVRVGHQRVRHLRVINPHDYPQHVSTEKFPHKKNFRSVHLCNQFLGNIIVYGYGGGD